MRHDILRLIEHYPGISQGRVGRFMDCDVGPYVDTLIRDGLVVDRLDRAKMRGRPARHLWLTVPPREVVTVSERHAKAHAEAKVRVARWMLALGHDPLTQEVLAELMRAPAEWAADRRLADLMSRCGVDEGGKGWMRPGKVLAEMGVMELNVRKGAGRDTTCRLLDPPPYPLE